ncbi:MAG: hypothetical protein AAB401_08635 [Acidobacteriota bacterium]
MNLYLFPRVAKSSAARGIFMIALLIGLSLQAIRIYGCACLAVQCLQSR